MLAGGGLAALLAPSAAAQTSAVQAGDRTVSRYVSRPDLTPPMIDVTTSAPALAEGYAFVAPINGTAQHGPLIVDNDGEPVWFQPSATLSTHDFRVQTLDGKPVLTWWEGQEVDGYPQGECVIADTSYRVQHRLSGNFSTEEHEFLITPRNTALISSTNRLNWDLSSYGGPTAGSLVEGVVQEIDIATGKVLLEWHSADHVAPDESYRDATDVWDYFHLNSIGLDIDDHLLVSARHTSTVYKLDRHTGEIIWHLGGKKNDFELGPGVRFAFQHDARGHPGGLLSLFDNGAYSPESAIEPFSRAIVLGLDTAGMRARLVQEIPNPHRSLTRAMGNFQLLANGGGFVGWGTTPEFSEFSSRNKLVFDARFVGGAVTYRAFRHTWNGNPITPPDIAVSRNANGTLDVHTSWNGATNVSHWQVLGGPTAKQLRALRTVPRRGFETRIRLQSRPTFVAAVPLDAAGRKLRSSTLLRT
jgi:hypothetical protein